MIYYYKKYLKYSMPSDLSYKDKYLKYKMKYLELKQSNMIQTGGDKIGLNDKNIRIEKQIYKNDSKNKIIDKDILNLLNKAYNKNETEHIPHSDIDGEALMWKIYYNDTNELVGYGVTTDLEQFEKYDNFESKGGIKGNKGLYITSVAGNSNYSGIVKILFDNIKKYAEENEYDYLLLEAKKYEPNYLVTLYKKQGFTSIIELTEDGETGTLMCNDIKNIGCDKIIKENMKIQTGGRNGKNKFNNKMDELVKQLNSNYGIVISKNNKIIYEKYVGNNKDTRFRIFSCSKPITAMAIFLLAQQNKLKLIDTIDKFCINIPYNNKITINHLLNHTSGVYDFSSEIFFNLKPKEIYDKILGKYETEFIDFETTITEINKNKPYFKPQKNPFLVDLKNYNNTAYDILGYIIYIVSGKKTDEFIKENIFNKLNMTNSGFQSDKHENESIPYEDNKKQGIKEQQNWYCGNAYIVCTLRDYIKYLDGYEKLLDEKYLDQYQKLYYFGKTKKNDKNYNYFNHEGGGDFSHKHSTSKGKDIKYYPLSRTLMVKFYNGENNISIIMSENYQNNNGFFSNNYKNWNEMIDQIIEF
jgi:CubicO group peptidase (beta-lactamase class C family)